MSNCNKMRLNRTYILTASVLLMPIYIISKWNMDQTCQSLSKDKYSKVVPDENDDIYFNFKQEEAYKYNGTSKKVEDSESIKRSVTDVCSYSQDLPTRLNELTKKQRDVLMKHVIVNDKYKFLYCYTPKVACSNWKKVVMLLEGKIDDINQVKKMDHSGFTKLSEYKEDQIRYMMENYYKFMFVRNPSERVVSAYRNKFGEVESSYKVFGKKINEMFNPAKNTLNYEGKVVGDDVEFRDFIKYLNNEHVLDMDEHWMPMNELCQPCIMKYDFIGTTDNIEQDSETVLRAIKAPDHVHFPKRQSFYKPTSKSLEHFYWSLVSMQDVTSFVQKYVTDYRMFNYDKPHFSYGHVVLP